MSNHSPDFEKWHKTISNKPWTYKVNSAGFYEERCVQYDFQLWQGATQAQEHLVKHLRAENALLNEALNEDNIFVAMDAARKSQINLLRNVLRNTWDWVDPDRIPKEAIDAYQRALELVPSYPEVEPKHVNGPLVVVLADTKLTPQEMAEAYSGYPAVDLDASNGQGSTSNANLEVDDMRDALQAFLKFANGRRSELGELSSEMEAVVQKAELALGAAEIPATGQACKM